MRKHDFRKLTNNGLVYNICFYDELIDGIELLQLFRVVTERKSNEKFQPLMPEFLILFISEVIMFKFSNSVKSE